MITPTKLNSMSLGIIYTLDGISGGPKCELVCPYFARNDGKEGKWGLVPFEWEEMKVISHCSSGKARKNARHKGMR